MDFHSDGFVLWENDEIRICSLNILGNPNICANIFQRRFEYNMSANVNINSYPKFIREYSKHIRDYKKLIERYRR